MNESLYYQEGQLACEQDYNDSRCDFVSLCPYSLSTPEAKYWQQGYDEHFDILKLNGAFSY